MNLGQAPWWAGLLFAVLTFAKAKYPEHAVLIDALITGLAAGWGVHFVGVVRANGGNGNGGTRH